MSEKVDTLVFLASKDVNMLSSPCEGEKLGQLFQNAYFK